MESLEDQLGIVRGFRTYVHHSPAKNCGRDIALGKQNFSGRKRHTLINDTGQVVAVAAVDRVVELSHHLDATMEAIKHSYLAIDGKPLFTLRPETMKQPTTDTINPNQYDADSTQWRRRVAY